MYRVVRGQAQFVKKYAVINQNIVKRLSTVHGTQKRISTFKVIVYSTLTAGASLAGFLVYSKYDEDFRRDLEKKLPFTRNYLLKFDDFCDKTFNASNIKSAVNEQVEKLKSYIPKAKDLKHTESNAADKVSSVLPARKVDEKKTNDVVNEKKTSNERLTYSDEDFISFAKQKKAKIDEAIKLANDRLRLALDSIDEYQKYLIKLLEGNDNITDTDRSVSRNFENAISSLLNVSKLISDFENEIKQITCEHESLKKEFEGFLNKEKIKVMKRVSKVKRAYSVEHIINHFDKLVKSAKEKLALELESLSPSNESDPRVLIVFACRKIEELQKQIAALNSLKDVKVQRAVQLELDRRIRQLRNEVRSQIMNEIKDETDKRVKHELTLQASALEEHYATLMKEQKAELRQLYELQLEEMRMEEKNELHKNFAVTLARIEAIDKALKNRAYAERKAQLAQEVWIACSHIDSVVGFNRLDLINSAYQLHKKMADSFAYALLDDISESAVTGHVENEQDLCNRFSNVHKIARRLVGVNESHKKLWHYLCSYFLSFLSRKSSKIKNIDKDSVIDPHEFTTFDLLDAAEKFVAQNDLLSAVRILNLVEGEAKNALKSWIADTLRYLQIKQSSLCLLALATKSCLTAMPAEHIPKS